MITDWKQERAERVRAGRDRLLAGLRQNNLPAMLLHLLDDKTWDRIQRPTGQGGFESFTREDVHDVLRLLKTEQP